MYKSVFCVFLTEVTEKSMYKVYKKHTVCECKATVFVCGSPVSHTVGWSGGWFKLEYATSVTQVF